jgi:parvulin-like peptidyl-prolyl isomerase
MADLPDEFRSSFDSLAAGRISRPIRSDNSFTLLFVDKRVAGRPLTLEDDYSLLAEKARDIYAQKKLSDLVRKWRQSVYIDIRL